MMNNQKQGELNQMTGPKVVTIGGGTGSSTVVRGLTRYTSNITAIVTVADDGGSSGRLRRDFGILPPGDFRNNIAALSYDETLMTQLLQYRFGGNLNSDSESELKGHAFGNLLLTALVGLTGSFEDALKATRRVLALQGEVFPSTLTPVHLVAEIETDEGIIEVEGESKIPEIPGRIRRIRLNPANVRGYPAATRAILGADLVVIGPGSLYTSILPNLLVADIAQALKMTRAKRAFVCNVSTQRGETDHFSIWNHYEELTAYIGHDSIDILLANNNVSIPAQGENQNTTYVEIGERGSCENIELIESDLVDRKRPWRHDSAKLAKVLIGLIEPGLPAQLDT